MSLLGGRRKWVRKEGAGTAQPQHRRMGALVIPNNRDLEVATDFQPWKCCRKAEQAGERPWFGAVKGLVLDVSALIFPNLPF